MDEFAWRAEKAFVLRRNAKSYLELAESWVGGAPSRDEVRAACVFMGDSARREASIGFTGVVVFFERPNEGKRMVHFVDAAHGVCFLDDRDVGPEVGVERRVRHVFAVRRALDRVGPRATAVMSFLKSDVDLARDDALDRIAASGSDGLLVLRRVLQDGSSIDLHAQVLAMLGAEKDPELAQDLTDYVEHELVYWKAVAPTLAFGWLIHPPRGLMPHHDTMRDALRALLALRDPRCERPVREFLKLHARLPSSDYDHFDDMKEAMEAIEKWLDGVAPPTPTLPPLRGGRE